MLKSKFSRTLITFFMVAALGATSASALTAEQKVFKEVKTQNADGTTTKKRVEADLVTPGETVIYALSYYNDDQESASGIVLTMPVPEVVVYEEGSAERDQTRTTYSADGGKSYAARDDLMVTDADGRARAAASEDITHIRWLRLTSLEPGQSGELSFAAELK